ncbi:hypothetical protein I5W42_11375 [Stenotrophomonas maltophilia]|nr:hypothetical protein [Stenotrophomonas maltophilia]
MEDLKIREWVSKQVQPDVKEDEINALRAAFRLSIISLLRSQLSRLVSEETMTGAFLGAAAASVGICAEAYTGLGSPACSWIQYSKSGNHENSESVNGADFALLIRMRDGRARLAIFQAKRKLTGSHQVNLSRVKKDSETSSGKEQFLRLVDYGQSVCSESLKFNIKLEEMHWIHYLLYQKSELNCCSIDQMKDLHDAFMRETGGNTEIISGANENKKKSDDGTIDLSEKKLVSLASLLDIGATEPNRSEDDEIGSSEDPRVSGWLEIQNEAQLSLIIERLANKVDLYFAEENGGHDYEPNLKTAITGERRYTMKQIVAILFNEDGSFKPPSFGSAAPKTAKSRTRKKDIQASSDQAPGDDSLSIRVQSNSDESNQFSPPSNERRKKNLGM